MSKTLTYEDEYIQSCTSERTRKDICSWILPKLPHLGAEVEGIIKSERLTRYTDYDSKPNHYNQTDYGKHIEEGVYSEPRSSRSEDVCIQREKNIAKALWMLRKVPVLNGLGSGRGRLDIGIIEDYEVPLLIKGSNTLKRCIDLVSAYRSPDGLSDKLYFLELKKNNSRETLMRCILEAYTYVLFSDRKRIRQDFHVSSNASIVICPLIFEGTNNAAYEDLLALNRRRKSDGGCDLRDLIDAIKMGPGLSNHEPPIEFRVGVLSADELLRIAPVDRNKVEFNKEWLK